MTKTRIVQIAAVGLLAVATLSGCWGDNHRDDNRSSKEPTGPARVLEFPDGFRNVAAKCDGTTMVYSVSAGADDTLPGGVAVVPNDPRCK